MSAQSDNSAEWFKKAESDLSAARSLASPEKHEPLADIWSIVAFHAHQAAEKYLKGFLVSKHQMVKKTHDLSVLLLACVSLVPSLDEKGLEAESRIVNGFYVSSRYPESASPSEAEARRAIAFAEEVKTLVAKGRNG